MEDWEEGRFEEIDDIIDDFQKVTFDADNYEEYEDERHSFEKFYAPVRAVFSNDSKLLEDFSSCKEHKERLNILMGIEVLKKGLQDVKSSRPPVDDEVPSSPQCDPKPWKQPPKLSYGPNKKYPHLSKAVEVKTSKAEGRYMVAKQKISPGDVLVVDTPYITSLFSPYGQSHCSLCFKRVSEEWKVCCPYCDKVIYCSEECQQSNYFTNHRYECGLLDVIDNQEIGRMATLAYRIVARAGFLQLSRSTGESQKSEATYDDQDYLGVLEQEDNRYSRTVGDHLKRNVTAILLTRCLQLSGWFPQYLREEINCEEVLNIAAIVCKHIQSCSCNAYEINEFIRRGHSLIDCQNVELGGAVYPTISLSNHSCCANTSRTNYGRYGVVHATKTIFPNEKVYDNYGHFYHTDSREQRQQVLKTQYFFSCMCQACKEDWDTYRDIARREPSFCCPFCKHPLGSSLTKVKKCPKCKKDLKSMVKIERQLAQMHTDFRKIMDKINDTNAQENIAKFSKLLTEIEKVCKMPSKELITCQQILLQCYAVLGNSHVEYSDSTELVTFNGNDQDFDDDYEEDSDEDDMPGLI